MPDLFKVVFRGAEDLAAMVLALHWGEERNINRPGNLVLMQQDLEVLDFDHGRELNDQILWVAAEALSVPSRTTVYMF